MSFSIVRRVAVASTRTAGRRYVNSGLPSEAALSFTANDAVEKVHYHPLKLETTMKPRQKSSANVMM
jgi:hypothetical protein